MRSTGFQRTRALPRLVEELSSPLLPFRASDDVLSPPTAGTRGGHDPLHAHPREWIEHRRARNARGGCAPPRLQSSSELVAPAPPPRRFRSGQALTSGARPRGRSDSAQAASDPGRCAAECVGGRSGRRRERKRRCISNAAWCRLLHAAGGGWPGGRVLPSRLARQRSQHYQRRVGSGDVPRVPAVRA